MRRQHWVLWVCSVCWLAGCPLGENSGSPPATETDGGAATDMQSAPDAASLADLAGGGGVTTPLVVQNPSFEMPVLAAGKYITSTPPPNWQSYGAIDNSARSIGALNPRSTALYLDPVPDGQNVGVVFLLDRPADPSYFANSEAGLQQTLAATLTPSSEYTLLVDVGNINTDGSPEHPFAFAGFPNYRIDLMAGGQVLASDTNTLRPGEGRFLPSMVKYVTGNQHPQMGLAIGIRLVNLNSAIGTEVNFDNVRLNRTSR